MRMLKEELMNKWKFHIFALGECWYAYGGAFEIEWSPIFHGVYFKIGCIGCHIGYWKGDAHIKYQKRNTR